MLSGSRCEEPEARKQSLPFLNWKGCRVATLLAMTLVLIACTGKRQDKLLESAKESLLKSNYAESAELFKKVIALNPESDQALEAMYRLGDTEETHLKDYEAALFNYKEFIRHSKDPKSVYEIQKKVAEIYFNQLSDSEKSIVAYKKLIELDPLSPEADQFQFKIAQTFFRTNQFEQARIEYQSMIDRYPKTNLIARARFEIGNSYYMEGKYDTGADALKHAIRLHPQGEFAVEAEFLLAQCYEQSGKLKEALQTYENLESRYPSKSVLNFRKEEIKKLIKKK